MEISTTGSLRRNIVFLNDMRLCVIRCKYANIFSHGCATAGGDWRHMVN